MGWGLGMVVFWVLLIVVIVLLVRAFPGPRAEPPRRDALDTLRERYAAGEIDDEEFERRKKTLER
ncbi:SHOCT domain-containing protein [Roseibacterium sp. SDUM158017]|uniref:SHOCT domain-containing protein n=1 Tax=Roseicyclus salinarum TaxID=3036773 RepID=UPI00241594F2|nr:SHOCT domain-containing protein [Roseibacterium sp. SDUM158017]MDG4647284.1 SHOCT domain-containing protein [Roseibacterium sp. SDUM158017]